MRSTAALALAILLLAPQGGAAAGEGEPSVTDAAGDATLANSGEVVGTALAACQVAGWVTFTACGPVWGVGGGETLAGGVPAPPTLDLLSVSFADTPSEITATMKLGSLDPSFGSATQDPLGTDSRADVWYGVCWERSGGCGATLTLGVEWIQGKASVLSYFSRFQKDCNNWWWCGGSVPYELRAGTPGEIVWHVPRDLLHDPNETIDKPFAFVSHTPHIHGDDLSWQSNAGNLYGSTPTSGGYFVDAADNGDSLHRTTLGRSYVPQRRYDPAATSPWNGSWAPPACVSGSRPRPEEDVQRVDVWEASGSVSFSIQLAKVNDAALNQIVYLSASFPGATVRNFGSLAGDDGKRQGYGGYCSDAQCSRWTTFPVNVTTVPGSPGRVVVTASAADLGAASARDRMNLLTAGAVHGGSVTPDPLDKLSVSQTTSWKYAGLLPRYQLGTNVRLAPASLLPRASPRGLVFEDAVGDAKPPVPDLPLACPDAVPACAAEKFDITFVSAAPDAVGYSRLAIGIANVSSTDVPQGYNAELYAIGLQTEKGSFVVGWYKVAGSRVGAPESVSFCRKDTIVLVPPGERKDPTQEGTPARIQGEVTEASASGQPGGGGQRPGVIEFKVPNDECFQAAPGQPIRITRMGAGTFLFGPNGDIQQQDGAESGGGVLEAMSVAAPAGPSAAGLRWYDPTSGDFWNVWGVVGALAASIVGFVLVKRRQGTLRRYLARVEKAAAIPEPRSRERELVDLRAILKRDLLRGAISEGHFVIVERKIDEHLSSSRLAGIVEAFGDLPVRLVEKLKEVLKDGQLTRHELRVFSALLEDTGLTEEAKARIRRKLELWVQDDAAAPLGAAGTRTVPVA